MSPTPARLVDDRRGYVRETKDLYIQPTTPVKCHFWFLFRCAMAYLAFPDLHSTVFQAFPSGSEAMRVKLFLRFHVNV